MLSAAFAILFFHPKIISRKIHDVTKQGKILFYFAYVHTAVYIQYLSGRTTQGNPVSELFCSQKSRYKYENKHFYTVGAKHDILRDITDRNTGMSQLLNQCTLLCDSKQGRKKKATRGFQMWAVLHGFPKHFFCDNISHWFWYLFVTDKHTCPKYGQSFISVSKLWFQCSPISRS